MRKALFFFVLLLCSLALWANQGLSELLNQSGAVFYWDSLGQSGRFVKGDREVSFMVGSPYLMLDGQIVWEPGIELREGELFFPTGGFNRITEHFTGTRPTGSGGYRVSVIVLDPGHGGRDWGAYSRYEVDGIPINLREKNINLDVGLRAAEILRQRFPDKEIAMTRSDDRYVALTERVAFAEAYEFSPQEGMVFLSIHTNASLNTRGNGFEIWYLPDDFDRNLVEDDASDLNLVLNALWEEEFLRESQNLSRFILDRMEEQNPDMSNRGLKQNAWYMLRNQNMASCLIELAFLTNPQDAARLRETEFLERGALAIADGITDFIRYFESQ